MKNSKIALSPHQNAYFTSIDMIPLYNWIKCTEGDKKHTRINLEVGSDKLDAFMWEQLYDNYIKQNGLSETYIKLLKTLQKKASLELEYIINGDRFNLTKIEIEAAKLEQMMNNNGTGMSIEETLIHLSKWLQTWINSKNITVKEYFDLLKTYQKAQKNG